MKEKRLAKLRRLLAAALLACVCVMCLPAAALAAQTEDYSATCYADSSKGLNVRSAPSTDSDILGTLADGAEITVTGKTSDGWYRISYQGETGYVYAEYTTGLEETTAAQTDTDTDDSSVSLAAIKDTLITTPVLTFLIVGIVIVIIAIIFTVRGFLALSGSDEDDDEYDEEEYYEDDDEY